MSAENQPLQVVRAAYEAYSRRDFGGVFALLDPSITVRQTTLLPWGGEYHGHAGATEFFRLLGTHTEGTPVPTQFISAGDDVVAIGRLRGRARESGREFDVPIAHVWTVRDGRIVRFDAYVDTPPMLDALRGADAQAAA
jgi:ketosteroid isomerase-like protein